MVANTEIQNLAKTLLGGAVFSAVHSSITLLFLYYSDYVYEIGKFHSWPLIVFLVCGIALNALIISKQQKGTAKKAKTDNLKASTILKAIAMLLFSVIIFYIVAVMFGAPLFSSQEQTFMFSLLLTTLVVLPLLLNVGLNATVSILSTADVFEKDAFNSVMSIAVRFALFGAWLGAVVIPLDWDRPWQEWPIPCSLGALIGHGVSQLFILSLNLPKIAQTFGQVLVRKRRKYDL